MGRTLYLHCGHTELWFLDFVLLAHVKRGIPLAVPVPVPVSVIDPSVLVIFKPLDPREWSRRRKWTNVFLVAFQATLSPICSTLVAVGSSEVDNEFHVTNSSISALPVALFVVGLGLGPLYLAPLSEMYGRRIVYIVSFGLFCLFNIGGALVQDEVGFALLRLLAGLAGRSLIRLVHTRYFSDLCFTVRVPH